MLANEGEHSTATYLDDGAEHGRTTRSRAAISATARRPSFRPFLSRPTLGPPGVSNWSAGPPTLLRLRLLRCRSCLSYETGVFPHIFTALFTEIHPPPVDIRSGKGTPRYTPWSSERNAKPTAALTPGPRLGQPKYSDPQLGFGTVQVGLHGYILSPLQPTHYASHIAEFLREEQQTTT